MKSSRLLMICPDLPQSWPVAWMLTRLGHQVHVARSGADGLNKLEGFQFDLLLLQDPLPEGAAWELFYNLDDQTRHRTLVLTGEHDPLEIWRRRYPQAREVLGYPARPEELAAAVCELLIPQSARLKDRSFGLQPH